MLLISHALWTSQFAADPAIVGRGIRLSGDLYTVIGVMPASFRFPVNKSRNSVWTTLAVDNNPSDPQPNISNRGAHFLNAFGRLKVGATVSAGGPGSCGRLLRIWRSNIPIRTHGMTRLA